MEAANPTAAALLQTCAFLAPDVIPEELLIEVLRTPLPASQQRKTRRKASPPDPVSAPNPKLVSLVKDLPDIDTEIALLRTYSLLQRDPQEKTVRVHRLVQAVLQHQLSEREQRLSIRRIISAVNTLFPKVDYSTWDQCARYLPQALSCATWINERQMPLREGGDLLYRAGWYLRDRGQYAEAEPLYTRALHIREQVLGSDHVDTAASIYALAQVMQDQGKYEEAEPLYRRALGIEERVLGREHPETATTLHQLGALAQAQGKYEEAQGWYEETLKIEERVLGREHPETAMTVYMMGVLAHDQGEYEEAETLYKRALRIQERMLGSDHPDTAMTVFALGVLAHNQGRYEKAEALYKKALPVMERVLGHGHPSTKRTRRDYADLLRELGRDEEARELEDA